MVENEVRRDPQLDRDERRRLAADGDRSGGKWLRAARALPRPRIAGVRADLWALRQRRVAALLVLASEEEPLRKGARPVRRLGEEAAVFHSHRQHGVLADRGVPPKIRVDAKVAEGSRLQRLLQADGAEEAVRRLDHVVPAIVGVAQLRVCQGAGDRAIVDDACAGPADLKDPGQISPAQVHLEVADEVQ